MAGFEDVILRALEKQQPASADQRGQIYDSARDTLAKMLEKSENLNPENIFDQQQRLEAAIITIEQAYLAVQSKNIAASEIIANDSDIVPDVDVPDNVNDTDNKVSILRRRPFALMLLGTIVLVAIGMSAWWIYDQKLIMPAEMRDNSVPNPPKILAGESSGFADEAGWITIFEPEDPTGLVAPAASTAELGEDSNGSYVRLSSGKGELQRGFQMVVDFGILETLIGKTAIFEVTAKSSNSDNQQFVVTCQFGSLGNCGSNRFAVGRAITIFTFEMQFDATTASRSAKSAVLSLLADLTGQGMPLDIYRVRVQVQ